MTITFSHVKRLAASGAALALLGALLPTQGLAQANDSTPLLDRVSSAPVPEAHAWTLVAGSPPLTQDMADHYSSFLSWLLATPLTPTQRQTVQESLVADWKKGDRAGMGQTLSVLRWYAQVDAGGPAQRDFLRAQAQAAFLTQLRGSAGHDETARWLLGIYQTHHKTLAPGDPPLTRDISDACAEMIAFMLRETGRGGSGTADAAFKDACAQSLKAGYSTAGPSRQQYLAKMPQFWAAVRVAWPQMPEDQRAGMRQRFAVVLNALMPPAKIAPAAAQSLPTAAHRQISQAEFAREMRRMQMRHMMFMNMSGMMMQQHWNTMNTISNIGGGGGTYVNPFSGTAY